MLRNELTKYLLIKFKYRIIINNKIKNLIEKI